ncbi:NrsF family protein [Pseudorhodobacter sp. W20_MBD10_FR17]|uniref:NrsF family protein n=1 Tax=Pseudorhodobacter sp. W20_MBD10_FR17 TaxID=3240266 RepID=UPI003F9D6966
MKTDDFIRVLAADRRRHRPLRNTLLMALPVALALSALALWLTLGFRPDLMQSLTLPLSLARFLVTGALGFAGLYVSLNLARPNGRKGAGLGLLLLIACVALGLMAWAYITTPPDARLMATYGKSMFTCLLTIPVLSIVPAIVILTTLRQGATTVPALTGFVAGLAGSGLGAAVYAMYCTEDSPLFYVTWYGLAILAVAATSALVGSRVLRW